MAQLIFKKINNGVNVLNWDTARELEFDIPKQSVNLDGTDPNSHIVPREIILDNSASAADLQ